MTDNIEKTDTPLRDTPLPDLNDSGLFAPVIKRDYTSQETPRGPETPKDGPTATNGPATGTDAPKEVKKNGFRMAVKTSDEYKKLSATPTEGDQGADAETADGTGIGGAVTDDVPGMQYSKPINTNDQNGVAGQIGEAAGTETSEWIWGLLENFYPDLLAWMTEIDPKFVERAKLETDLEGRILAEIYNANRKSKSRFAISDFHRKNILPPLKAMLQKQGWEKAIPDSALLVIGLGILSFDSFLKITEVKRDNRLLEKRVRGEVQKVLDVRNQTLTEMEQLRQTQAALMAQLAQMQATQVQAVQAQAAQPLPSPTPTHANGHKLNGHRK